MKMIDPPLGWRYGFPKQLPDDVKDLRRWLLDQGYPESDVDFAVAHCRYWEEETSDSISLQDEMVKLSNKQYHNADWNNVFSDWCKESYDYIKFDTDWLHNCFELAYKSGFEEGYKTAKGIPTDDFGNFIEE
jgi:hypothetical protein